MRMFVSKTAVTVVPFSSQPALELDAVFGVVFPAAECFVERGFILRNVLANGASHCLSAGDALALADFGQLPQFLIGYLNDGPHGVIIA